MDPARPELSRAVGPSGSGLAGRILFFTAGAIAIVILGFGLFFYGYGVSEWAADGFVFDGVDGIFNFVFAFLGAAAITLSLIIAGFLARFSGWPQAPLASLVIALAATAHVAGFAAVLFSALTEEDDPLRLTVAGASLTTLAIAALPPFLHWRGARLMAGPADRVAKSDTPRHSGAGTDAGGTP